MHLPSKLLRKFRDMSKLVVVTNIIRDVKVIMSFKESDIPLYILSDKSQKPWRIGSLLIFLRKETIDMTPLC